MTLILSLATPHYVVQVADRMLTNSYPDGTTRTVEDNANKVVLFCNQMAFGYTGLARVKSNLKTDRWLEQELGTLSSRSMSRALEHIASRATETFKHIHVSNADKRHAFVGVGFASIPDNAPLRPWMVRISNYHDHAGLELCSAADRFQGALIPFEGRACAWAPNGCPMKDEERHGLTRRLNESVRKGVGPGAMIQSLVEWIRKVSDRLHGRWVGKALLAIAIPKEGAEREDVVLATRDGWVGLLGKKTGEAIRRGEWPPTLTAAGPSSLFFPAGSNSGKQYSPRVVCPGMGAMSVESERRPRRTK